MNGEDPRMLMAAAAAARGDSLAALSRMIGRNPNYLQQWVTRGSPRLLAEADRHALADYLGLTEEDLGGPPRRDVARRAAAAWRVPRLDVAASAGPGATNDAEQALGAASVPPELARSLNLRPGAASIIRVRGDSMAPGLIDGDELLVDGARRTADARGGVYVLRRDGVLLVKRVAARGGRLIVTSDNPAALPVAGGAIEILGRVVWQMRRL